ncbi:hypothetical protein [Streptomyces cinereospinus]|uniref:ATP-binding protein n=1 Tax=Streptomyces cinereospinus TaxID=285561 RepID=A0ABV5MVQ5_9ACTN
MAAGDHPSDGKTEDAKAAAGTARRPSPASRPWSGVRRPAAGRENGSLRFTVRDTPPEYDPDAVEPGGGKDPLMAPVAATVQALLPHPAAPAPAPAAAPDTPAREPEPAAPALEDDHDALLRRLREPGGPHRTGVPTGEEFTPAERAVLRRMRSHARTGPAGRPRETTSSMSVP